MKNVGKLVLMLSLIAMAPSFAGKASKANEPKKSTLVKKQTNNDQTTSIKTASELIEASHFKPIEDRIVFIDNNACPGGDGSLLLPYSTLEEAQDGSKPGQILYVIAREKPYTADLYPDYDSSYDNDNPFVVITLQASQSIISSGCTFKIGNIEIPATTPGEFATIEVPSEGVGIVMTNCNHVAGFIFTPQQRRSIGMILSYTGIGSNFDLRETAQAPYRRPVLSSGIGGKSSITKNRFENLTNGIDLNMQGWSSLDISANQFRNVQDGISVLTQDGDVVHICDNYFTAKKFDVHIDINSLYSERKKLSKAERHEKLDRRGKTPSSLDAPSSSSDAAEVFIKGNEFDEGFGVAAIVTANTKKVEICKNCLSGNVKNGFSITQATPIESQVCITENKFDIEGKSLGNSLKLTNVHLEAKKNAFSGGEAGLLIEAGGNVTAHVEENSFKKQLKVGFNMSVDGNPAAPCCLKLVKNHAKSHIPNFFVDFQLQNLNLECDSAFDVAVQDITDGERSLQRANFGGSTQIDGPVVFVRKCSDCHESK